MLIDFKENSFFIASAIAIILATFLFLTGGENTKHLWDEGHLTEIVTEFGYLAAIFLFFFLARRQVSLYLKLWLYFWSFCALVFFGEETSWLQHYANYTVPEDIAAMNTQSEFNLHNLNIFQSKSLMDGEVSLLSMISAQHLFQLGFFAYFLALPILATIPFFKSLVQKFEVPVIGIRMMIFIWVPTFITIAYSILSLSDPLTKSAMAEVREMCFGLGIGMFAISCLITLHLNKIIARAASI